MSIILFFVTPIALMLLGKLIGLAVAATWFYSAAGKRAGRVASRWCTLAFPAIYLSLLIVGGEGDAGHGIRVFGSDVVLELTGMAIYFGVPILAAYAGAVYVVRDLTWGHKSVGGAIR